MKKLFIIIIAMLAVTTMATAQSGRTKFATDMYQAKHEMIIEELGLDLSLDEEYRQIFESAGFPPLKIVSESRAALVSACQSKHMQVGQT